MSRTIRRNKNVTTHNWLNESDYLKERPLEWDGYKFRDSKSCWSNWWKFSWFPLIKMEGKKYKQAYNRFHSDCKPDYNRWSDSTCREEEGCYRVSNKNKVSRWLKDPDFEIIDTKHKTFIDYY
jgi:hypothetical protein